MIFWFTIVQVIVACAAGVVALVAGFAGRKPNDIVLGGAALVELLLIIQVVVAIVAPAFGNAPTGDPLEFWIYGVSVVLLPIAAAFWALIERSRWSCVVLGVALLAVAIMVYRMNQIWLVQTV